MCMPNNYLTHLYLQIDILIFDVSYLSVPYFKATWKKRQIILVYLKNRYRPSSFVHNTNGQSQLST